MGRLAVGSGITADMESFFSVIIFLHLLYQDNSRELRGLLPYSTEAVYTKKVLYLQN